MYSIAKRNWDGIEVLVLYAAEQDIEVCILPQFGAMLHTFSVNGFNVIEQYENAEALQYKQEALGFKSAKLSPFVCREQEAAFVFEGNKYLLNKFKLGRHAIHGLLYNKPFNVIAHSAHEHEAVASCRYLYQDETEGFPFAYECIVTYILKKNVLTLHTNVINTGNGNMPLADGWHPYFTLGAPVNELYFEMQTGEHFIMDDELLPTGQKKPYEDFVALAPLGNRHFDDCFSLNFETCQPLVVLKNKLTGLIVEIRPKKSYPFLQVYTPNHRGSIALENLSALPNSFHNGVGLKTLAPGQEAVFETSYVLRKGN